MTGLLLITDRTQAVHPLLTIARAALHAGFDAFMLREKDLDGRPLLELAEPLSALCRSLGKPFLVNDRLDVALALQDAGAHVGASGIPVADARRLLGRDRILGYSAHEVAEARGALASGADYITLSPIFPSASKPELPSRGLPWFAEAARALPGKRVVALGGMQASNLRAVRDAGAIGAAVMGELMRSKDPGATAKAMVLAWREAG